MEVWTDSARKSRASDSVYIRSDQTVLQFVTKRGQLYGNGDR